MREFVTTGDCDHGFAESDVIVEWTSAHHNMQTMPAWTMGCMIYWEDDGGIYTNSYQADHTRMMVANMLDMPINKVRVICHYLGGSIGRWNTGDQSFFILLLCWQNELADLSNTSTPVAKISMTPACRSHGPENWVPVRTVRFQQLLLRASRRGWACQPCFRNLQICAF